MPPQLRERNNSASSSTLDDESSPGERGEGHTLRRVVSEAEISVSEYPNRYPREYRVRKSSLIGMIDWTHVIGTHAPQIMAMGILILLGQIVHQVVAAHAPLHWDYATMCQIATAVKELLLRLYHNFLANNHSTLNLLAPYVRQTALLLLTGAWLMRRQRPVYLMSFATFKPPASWKMTHEEAIEIMRRQDCFTEDSLLFMQRILERSGTGQATAWPPGIIQSLQNIPQPDGTTKYPKSDRSIAGSRKEAETVIFTVVKEALEKANVQPRDIDVLVINCSLFSPTPSLCAMVLSHFGMRSDVATYNLSGMGCSASLIAIDLAQQLLRGKPSYKKALVVSTEILTPNFYHGNDRAFLIQNTLFRCGGAAMVLSSRWSDGRRAWYKLLHTVRVQGTGEAAYECVYQAEDSENEQGVRLSKDIVKVAGKCMEKNFTMLGPQVLPWSEQALVVLSIIVRYLQKSWGVKEPIKPYVPDFKTAFDHFCIHAGGRGVIDGIEKNLKLEPYHTEPSRMTLYNYGNTSSSSIWYELEYIQDHNQAPNSIHPLRKGDRILQVAFGSGFKCTSGVWLKL